ncbi:MAG: SAM-dependent methyltransferase [Streptosporangiales bacterium]|nr:SAM-dependent methyltransferase [Streptosporangiales bacterium]
MQPEENLQIDPTVPTVARVYDYYLGGTDNYEADRILAAQIDELLPGTRGLALNNRRFLERITQFLASDCGIRQFIDHGSGLPTQNNVHQIAQRVHPDARVIYNDNDSICAVHGQRLLADDDSTAFILADMRDTDIILNHPDTKRLIDFSEPVAVLFNSVLHCIPDRDDPIGLVHRVMDRVAPGSYLALAHLVSDDPDMRRKLTDLMLGATQGNWGRLRTVDEVRPCFDGLEVIEPGLVELTTWRPDDRRQEQTWDMIEFPGFRS